MQIQTVRAVYSGSVTRKLTFTGIKPVIVSGDMDATIIEFSIPSQYDGFNRFIEWNVQIKDTNGKYVYPLYEITDDKFTVPHEITYFGNGKEASFSLILTNGDVVEKSIPLTVPVIWASDALELHDGDDFKKIFNAFVSAIYHTGEFTDETYSPSTIEFTTAAGSKYILNIPLPYLDENHKIMWKFIPEIPIEKVDGLNEVLTELSGAITTEANERQAADDVLQTNINNEASARASADSSLRTDLNAEITARTDGDAELSGAITTETNERKTADSTLQSNIDSEESARIAGDNTLQTNINNEASARASADSTLQSNIDAEESARIAGDNALQTSKQDTIISRVLTIPQTGWTDKVQVLAVTGLMEKHRIIMTYELSSSYIATLANVQIQSHTGGSITFVCDDTPTGDVLVDITVY